MTRVEPGKLWLRSDEDRKTFGPIALPQELTRLCKEGWTVSGLVGRVGRKWVLYEAWNVYPL